MQLKASKPSWDRILSVLSREKFMVHEHRGLSSVSMHEHAFLELTYVTSGTVEHNLDGQITVLREGDYFIVDYGSQHSYSSVHASYFDNLDCLFLPELLDPVLKGTKCLRTLLEHY